jgi:hypothetical protein
MLARIHRSSVLLAFAAFGAAAADGCSRPVDLAKALHITDVSTGWFDAGIVDGKNKLVPSITFTLHNSSAERLLMQMNVMFVILPQKEDQDDVFLQNIEVPANGTSKPVTVRAKYGFTGEQPRADMLQHRLFQDFTVRLFAKRGSAQWTLLGEYPVKRQLLTR